GTPHVRRPRARFPPTSQRAEPYSSCGDFSGARRISLLFLAKKLTGNHQFLNLAGAFPDGTELHVAIIFLRRIIFDEAIAAVNLNALVGHLHGDFAVKE